jgi:mono/diheme cytochrome c family protein
MADPLSTVISMNKKLCFTVLLGLIMVSCSNNNKPENPEAEIPAKAEQPDGKALYIKYCMACHQTNGSGVPGMYPPLTRSDWVEGDKTRLIGILVNGLKGEITVNGQVYKTAMPDHQYLNDGQIAAVLTYVRSNFGNDADSVTVGEVTAFRKGTTK